MPAPRTAPLTDTRVPRSQAIILGIGGDNSAQAVGTFYEGAITLGLSLDAADDAVQHDIVSARYGA